MKRIYPAGPYSWQARIREHAEELQRLGYTITAEWLDQAVTFTRADNTTDTTKPGLHADCERLSKRDLRNIVEADTLILFEPGVPLERNTRVAEFGAALLSGRRCIVIGPEDEDKKDVISNIFVMLEDVVEDWGKIRWASDDRSQNELRRIKPVARYRNWELFLADILNPEQVECCSGCGEEYRVRDCDCPAGSYYTWKTRVTNFEVIPPPEEVRQSAALAAIK